MSGFLTIAAFFLLASQAAAGSAIYTTNLQFDTGSSINVVHLTPDQLSLDETTKPFPFVWVAVSTKGTVVKIDATTGAVLGEYNTAPSGRATDPSRTTVDKNGSVWVSNRGEYANGMGSITHIGLKENGQCVDRNGNGSIDTSTAYGDIRPWTNAGDVDSLGGVTTAQDECIIHYVRVNSTGTRHISVDGNNNIWVSGTGDRDFDLINGATGAIIRHEPNNTGGYGGYGGLIDKNNVIWSSNYLLRWDTANPLTGVNGVNWRGYSHDSYGLGIDSQGNVWNTSLYGNQIRKFSPAGDLLGTFGHGNYYAQGVAVDQKGDVWVAHSILGPQSTVGHLKNDGTFVGNINVGSGPTGVAVDAAGKIWVTNYYSRTVSRIDPNLGPVGGGGFTIGAVDLTTRDLGGNLYNYSDMTGSILIGAPTEGTWSVVYDSGLNTTKWGTIVWNGSSTGLTVSAASSNDPASFPGGVPVASGSDFNVPDGRYLKVNVKFTRSGGGASPVLYDLAISSTITTCDVDNDGDIDKNDINAITLKRNTPASPPDSRDADGDGIITVLDARVCATKCTRALCVVQ